MSEQRSGNVNGLRPAGAEPVPNDLIQRYGAHITDVWWFAKGREGPDGDPTIGVEIEGIRKTFSGYVHNDWWYFQKTVHAPSDPDELPQCYWYRKRKVPDPANPDEFITEEEYVGENLVDPDSGLPIDVPEGLQHDPRDLCG